ncbi:MAG: polyprenyl synthetase family protein [Fimbriimonas sp.]|nr:polyprenyl synthetase family protein [Fimbriimonas sp.]
MANQSSLNTYGERIDRRLGELLPPADAVPEKLHEAMRHSCLAPGKRLRPALAMACAESIGGNGDSVLDAGCAIEFVHCFSLIHDDLPAIDNDDLRRGIPTCHKVFGEAIAILAGDALFALAFDTLANGPWPADQRVRAIRSLTLATGSSGLVGGETIDILSEGKPIERSTLELIHARKTGSLIASSCEIGAILAGATSDQSGQLYRYGQAIGLAFQIADDLLNETSTAAQLGKAAGSDRERGKATYPAMFGVEASRRMAIETAESGIACLVDIPNPNLLAELARYSVERLR